jgi:uncharacterized protein YbjT (DUF2867 family)
MILVVGATGLLGTRVCERLRAEGRPVRALPESCNAKLLAKRVIIATGADCHRPEAEGRERLSIGLQGKNNGLLTFF